MRPELPKGPAARAALYILGLIAALKALSLVLMAQAVASLLSSLASSAVAEAGSVGPVLDWQAQMYLGAAGVLLRAVTVWAQGVAARRAALGVKEELRASLLSRALRDAPGDGGGRDGGLAVLATRGLDALDNYYTQFLPALVNCATIPLLIGVRILFADWVSALVVVLTVPLVPLFMVLIGRYTEDKVSDAQAALSRLSSHMLELAKGLPVLVGLGRASAQRQALEDISGDYRDKTMGTLRTAFLSALALELISTLSVAVVAVFIGVRLVHGDMPLEAGLLALILAPDCYLPLRELGTAHHASDDGRAALSAARATTEAPEPLALPIAHPSRRTAGDSAPRAITAVGLSVTYPGRQAAAVGPLDFSAPAGLVTALDGPSGVGKSTVLAVLAGAVRGGTGTTVVGALTGVDRQRIAYVPQHPVLVEDSALEEVQLYLASADTHVGVGAAAHESAISAATAQQCLEAAAAGHLAHKHPAELSPGELRRVAFACGLARIHAGATLLLLDEPTAHLDDASATLLRTTIETLRGRVTTILIAHDSATREIADRTVSVGAGLPLGVAAHASARVGRSEWVGASARGTTAVRPHADVATSSLAGVTTGDAHDVPQTVLAASAGSDDVAPGNLPASAGLGTVTILRRLLAPVRAKFLLAGLLGTLAALFAVALSGLSGWLIIRASEQPPILYLLTAIVGVRFFGIGRAVLRYTERLVLHDAVFSALTTLRGRLWESLSRRALSLRRLLQGGSVLGTVIDDVDTVRDLIPRVALPPVTALGVGAAAVITTALLVPAALPATVGALILSLLVAPVVSLVADRRAAVQEQLLRQGVLRRISSALDGRAALQVNAVAPTILARLRKADREATAATQRTAWAEGLGQGITVAACGGAALLSLFLAGPGIADGSIAPEIAAVVVLMQLALVESYAGMTTAVRQFPALRAVTRRMAAAGVFEREHAADGDGLVPVAPLNGGSEGVKLSHLSAAWSGGEPVFRGLNATVEPGRWLAVTGPSGSGKSTLLSVLLGFLAPAAGSVQVTGRAAWCPQEAHLFDSTIRGNLLVACEPGAGGGSAALEPAMRDALACVGLSSLLRRLPQGLDTRIGPGGAFLSGGERQRLAVARTLMSGADVVLLDEPTAHLDAEIGETMLHDLRRGLNNRTVILVTHNAADISSDDQLLRLAHVA
ncbi:thiol reductant ABC exporter subunit CydD [Pseudarthrobacter sp. PS3-L1]|uniref:thiol reductant ABC exporter subunit CydD n=1 Tax=Pseudarthrobacter sp. PS3-L1 TaxID=3046207 RepID=UPI0024B88197|nr:thiol reductant ABC exporter subunit CydD [Pseudarthrobacter sp. PS3-L1]MDJ0320335.1 thiol reductant ABC exporter subunit CydD [Pseudarthrobacter sp. PS3-L1]